MYYSNSQMRPSFPPQPLPSINANQIHLNSTSMVHNSLLQNTLINSNQYAANAAASFPAPLLYWYPTPPVSPSSKLFFHTSPPPPIIHPSVQSPVPSTLIVKGAPFGITVADVLKFFHGYEVLI